MKLLYKNLSLNFLIFSFSLLTQSLTAQVKFINGNFAPSNNIGRSQFSTSQIQTALFEGKYFVVITFDKLPNEKIKVDMELAGIKLFSYIPANAYLATINGQLDFSVLKNFGVISVDSVSADYKIDKEILQQNVLHDPSSLIAISYFDIIEKLKVEEILKQLGAIIVHTKFDKDGLIFIKMQKEKLTEIASLPFVISINKQIIKDVPLNYNNNAAHGNNALSYAGIGGRSLTGKGITVGVGDDGNVESHIDFTGRLINRNGAGFSYHGTHTTGTTAGGGIIDPTKKGMSPMATIVSQYFSDIIVNAPVYFGDYNLTLTNNSYFSSAVGCTGNSKYDELSNYVDAQLKNNDNLLHVIAAGNDGTLNCSVYPTSFATIKSGWQTAKDVLTVGAIDNTNYSIASFSSRGPVSDGRLKPEIVAGGVAILSTIYFNGYGQNGGTSMAAPTVTGSLGLLVQRYKQLFGNANPKGFLLKALICNSAQDLGNKGPDFTYGFGKLNTRLAVEALESNHYFIDSVANGLSNQHNIIIPAGTKQLKVLLYWPDKEASPNAASALVNDLDIVITDPSTHTHQPLILNSTPGGVNIVATEGADHVNNIEQVIIDTPPAGNYIVNVSGYAVPFGPQPYAIAYEIDAANIFVEHPFGGETLVPGEIETIRWTANDDDTNTFNVEYSDDNGGTWQTINNNVPATQRLCSWTVPANATNTALIRVTRNVTGVAASSSFNFSILDQPDITLSVPCGGYVQVDWPIISNASAYDVLMLTGDSMKVIASTNVNTYLLKGLDINKNYWIAVAAKNGAVSGRRSLAKNITPTTGVCTLPDFNNDLQAVNIPAPTTGREFTSTSALATSPIQVQIKNLDDAVSTATFNVSYSINGSLPVTETITPTIAAGAIYVHTFAQHSIVPGPFVDNIKVWVTKTSDLQHANDTAYKIVKLLANPLSVLPFIEGFETGASAEYKANTYGLDGLDNTDFFTNSTFGRARSFVNTGFAYTGNKAITLDQTPKNASSTTDSLLVTHNLSNYSTAVNQLRLDFFYKNNGQDNLPGNKAWIRGSDADAWLPVYDLYANQGDAGEYKAAKGININEIFSAAVPQQNVSSSFQIKFGEEGFTSANSPTPSADEDDGYTFDDVKISEAINDVGITNVLSPFKGGCGLTGTTPISVTIKNYNNTTLNNIQVSYTINNGPVVSQTIPVLNPNQILPFTFSTTADLSAFIDYTLDVWVNYAADNYKNNDSILNYTFHNSPLITSYPYLERFETSNGNWYTKGTNSSWEWGTPLNAVINKAANGSKAWVTNLTGNYNTSELSYLYSPCFDLSGLAHPVLSFSHIFQVEDNCPCDYHWAEYSTDGGITWQKLGAVGSGTNWYDDLADQRWQASNIKWHVASIDVPSNSSSVRFRFVMSSDGGLNLEGAGIDDIHVFDKATIYTGTDVTAPPQNVSGNNWIDFNVGGNRIASINANGQDLGPTTVRVYRYHASVRNSNGQYYLNRNIVISPTNQPAANVDVRFYFTDDEANALINAGDCATCTKPFDAYELGVTKYSGDTTDENGNLSDDLSGYFQFILPANTDIVPFNNGYYAAFSVNNFSEFWLSKGDIKPAQSNICAGTDFSFTAETSGSTYQWQVDNGAGFTNIVDGGNYSGAATNTLQLIGLPTSFTGYKYRCVIDGVPGKEIVLRFTAVWNGNADTDWMNASNWNCNVVPDQYTDVIFPGGLPHDPILNNNTGVRSVKLYPGVNVLVKSGVELDIKGK